MKLIITFLLLLMPLLGQNKMTIHFDDGTIITKRVASIDSITFEKATVVDTLPIGTWKVTGIFSARVPDNDILDAVQTTLGFSDIPLTCTSDRSGYLSHRLTPFLLFLVYGEENMEELAPMEEVLHHYLNDDWDYAQWAIDTTKENSGTIKFRFNPAAMGIFLSKIELIGANSTQVDTELRHKFMHVGFEISDSIMIWTFSDATDAAYYTDVLSPESGSFEDELWLGWDASRFTRSRIEFRKVQ